MSYDFLRGYTIPITGSSVADGAKEKNCSNLQQPPQPPSCLLADEGNEQESPTTQQFQNPNRFIPPSKHGTNYRVPPSRPPLKRKYAAGPGAAPIKPEDIVETTADGKLTIFQGRDESYPDELNRLIHPLQCELCKTQANSMSSAKDHYESKAHDRQLRAWLTKNFNEKGLTPPEVKRLLRTGGPSGPEAFHCELCDLKLTSLTHANQHYAGRKHRLVASQTSKPSGAGYYNSERKWVRTGTKLTPEVNNDGRFGIGLQFKHEAEAAAVLTTHAGISIPDTTTSAEGDSNVIAIAKAVIDSALHCSLCNISVTSTPQMQMHLEGAKHAKKLKQSVVEVPVKATGAAAVPASATAVGVGTDVSILASLTEKTDASSDLSMYRTPTGSYYCKTCNITMPHVNALQQHLSGKKHLKKSVEEKAIATTTKVNTATKIVNKETEEQRAFFYM